MHALRRNTLSGSRSNIAAHYDLGNDFFQLFLDPTAMYSSAWWEHPDQSLEEASIAKLDRICQKLELTSSDHLLEIGTGWGGFAIHAARITGCRVTTTTISKEQHILAVERVHKAGLADRVTVLLEDYRDLQGEFDKVVSIEMLEAVGHQYLGEWFEAVDRLVKPGGNVVVQVITVPDQAWKGHTKRVDFIKKHIFPGSCLVSTGALLEAAGERTRMSMDWMEEMGLHYARTLSEWRHRFHLNKLKARGQGFDDRFLRMWDYYFAYCEAGFTERSIGLIQVRFQKPGRQCRLSAPVNQRKDKLLVGGPAA
jgi:cyclopropane-fatty-acyl-phospholipid synthase